MSNFRMIPSPIQILLIALGVVLCVAAPPAGADIFLSATNNGGVTNQAPHPDVETSFGDGDIVLGFSDDQFISDGAGEGDVLSEVEASYDLGFPTPDALRFSFSQLPSNFISQYSAASFTLNSGTLTFSPLGGGAASLFTGDNDFIWESGDNAQYDVQIDVVLTDVTDAVVLVDEHLSALNSTGGGPFDIFENFNMIAGNVYQLSYLFRIDVALSGDGDGSGSGGFTIGLPDGGFEIVPIPAPSAVVLAGIGLCCLRWRRRP